MAQQTKQQESIAAKINRIRTKLGKIACDGEATIDSKTNKKVKYPTLNAILDKLTPILEAEGVSYHITCVFNEQTIPLLLNNIRVFALQFIDVETGEVSETTQYPFRLATHPEPIKSDGSTITYATRYLLSTVLGIQPECDPAAEQQKQQSQPPTPSKTEIRQFYVHIENIDFTKAAEYLKSLQGKYPSYNFKSYIEYAANLKLIFPTFQRLINEGMLDDAKQTLENTKSNNPNSNFAKWEELLNNAISNI